KVLEGSKDNAAAIAGIEKVHAALLDRAKAALDRDDDNEAERMIAGLATLPEANAAEIEDLQGRLKLLKKVGPMLTRAANLLHQGHVATPADANALDAY